MSMVISNLPLLRLLADGEVHSGQALAASLAASRSLVRSQVRSIERLGLCVLAIRGRGYRLAGPLDLLDRERLAGLLQGAFTVELLDECHSTNGVLMERARLGGAHALALACEHQTAGRGRRGKRWESGIGTDLTFSVLWRFSQGAGALSGLSLAVGVALVRALARLGYEGVQLKWPNDLLLRGAKLGGILIEVTGDHEGGSAVVVGVGLNVRASAARAAAVDQPATALAGTGAAVASRTALLAGLLLELRSALDEFARAGFAPFRDEWLARHAWQGRRVTQRDGAGSVADGEAIGVGEDGALLVRSVSGVARFHSGELRLADR
jgi:BirA family transcriptional regulator, biotin operon repressor / biotin---[acetyl-CoA-carboxylase] ligase